jgi:hypothetical protein
MVRLYGTTIWYDYMVRLAMARYFRMGDLCEYSDMARTWIGFKPTSKWKTYIFYLLFG